MSSSTVLPIDHDERRRRYTGLRRTMSLDPMSAVAAALKREHIIPDVLPDSFMPSFLFSIVFPNGSEVLLGNEFTIDETQDEPNVSFTPMSLPVEQADSTGEEVGYTLVMLDPDVPARVEPVYRSFRHWVVRALIASLSPV